MNRHTLVCSLAALVFLACGPAMAATDFDFGIKAGANFSSLDVNNDFMDPGNRIGFAGGGMVVANFSETWAVQLEILYSSKGSSEEFEITDEEGVSAGTATGTFKLDYIEIPLLARFSPSGGPIFLIAGPSFAFKTSGQFTLEGVPDADDDLEWITDSDLGLSIGLGAAANSFIGPVEFDLRYTWGMTNLNDGEGAEFKNRALLATVGLIF